MEVENRIEETFSGQVEELPDDLKERRVHGNHHANGNGNGVILEESEEEDQGDVGMEKAPIDASQAINGRVIKKVCVESAPVLWCVVSGVLQKYEHLSNWIVSRPRDQPRRAPSLSPELQWGFLE